MTCNDRVGHDGAHHTLVNNVDENGEMDDMKLTIEWARNYLSEAAWN